jgi:hypothetical protein
MSDHRKRPRDFSQAATLDFKRDQWGSKGASTGRWVELLATEKKEAANGGGLSDS